MIDPTKSLYKNVTLNDVQLASAYYPLLVDLARHKHCLTYGELVVKAKDAYPGKEVVQKAIAVSTGRKLDVVRMFTAERDLPDLTCLIINKGLGECGVGFTQHFDPEATRVQVFAFDWSKVDTDFEGYIKRTETIIAPRPKRNREKALHLMSAFYAMHRTRFPPTIRSKREFIIELLEEGLSEEEAFAEALNIT